MFFNSFCEIPKYKRSYFKHWVDADRNCVSTRNEVLLKNNMNKFLIFKTDSECNVRYGLWYDYFSDSLIFEASDMDVDHIVPLANAWISGAYKWSPDKRKQYANYLGNPYHLMPVLFSQNRSKGSKSPDKWLPKNKKFHVLYCKMWIKIKNEWSLTVTKNELDTLKNVLIKEKNIQYPKLR